MKINFEFNTQYGKFSDALHFPDNQELPSDDEIEAMKQERLNNWITVITTPSSYVEDTSSEEPDNQTDAPVEG
jgi:hypothetical protein